MRDDKSNASESARLPDSKEDLQVTITGNTDITIPEHIELTARGNVKLFPTFLKINIILNIDMYDSDSKFNIVYNVIQS